MIKVESVNFDSFTEQNAACCKQGILWGKLKSHKLCLYAAYKGKKSKRKYFTDIKHMYEVLCCLLHALKIREKIKKSTAGRHPAFLQGSPAYRNSGKGKGLRWCCNKTWKILLEGNSAVCSSLLCSLPAPSLESKQHRGSTRAGSAVAPPGAGGHLGMRNRVFNFQWKTPADLPGIITEASHGAHSVTLRPVPGY